MNDEIKNLLESVRRGEVSVDEAYLKLRTAPFRDLGFAKIDTHRRLRTGAAEVIYGAGKTPEQMLEIIKAMLESGQETILITRLEKHAAEILNREFALTSRTWRGSRPPNCPKTATTSSAAAGHAHTPKKAGWSSWEKYLSSSRLWTEQTQGRRQRELIPASRNTTAGSPKRLSAK
mgnify:CR=1 FL=1